MHEIQTQMQSSVIAKLYKLSPEAIRDEFLPLLPVVSTQFLSATVYSGEDCDRTECKYIFR